MKGAEYLNYMLTDQSPLLKEEELFHLVKKYGFNFQKRDKMRSVLFQYIKQHASDYQRNKIPPADVASRLEDYYFPHEAGNNDFFYEAVPDEEIWRLFVDVKQQRDPQQNGFAGYERREPYCLQVLYTANYYIQATQHERLTSDYIRSIHKIAAYTCKPITVFSGWADQTSVPVKPGQFKGTENHIGYVSDNQFLSLSDDQISPLGLVEMFKEFPEIVGGHGKLTALLDSPLSHLRSPRSYESVIEGMIESYEKAVLSNEPLTQLRAVVQFIQQLERLHPFERGNTRTFMLLLNRELVRHGFSPTMLEDPKRFDGYTLDECVMEVMQGMENFKMLKQTGNLPNCKSTEAILSENFTPPIKVEQRKDAYRCNIL